MSGPSVFSYCSPEFFVTRIAIESAFADSSSRAIHPLLRLAVSRIVFRAEIFQSKRPYRSYLRDVLAGFRPVVMGRVARENDHGAGRIRFQLTRVEFIAESDIKDAGNHGVNTILWVHVRHKLLAVGHFNPDCVRAGLRGLTHDDGQPDIWRERRERFPIDIFGQDGFENLLPGLVRLDFALLSARYGAGFLRHTKLLRAHYVKHDHRLSKYGCSDCTPPAAILIT